MLETDHAVDDNFVVPDTNPKFVYFFNSFRIDNDYSLKIILDGLEDFRGWCGGLFSYDWISTPLVYTQVNGKWEMGKWESTRR